MAESVERIYLCNSCSRSFQSVFECFYCPSCSSTLIVERRGSVDDLLINCLNVLDLTEGTADDRSNNGCTFICHVCDIEFGSSSEHTLCPQCNSGFVQQTSNIDYEDVNTSPRLTQEPDFRNNMDQNSIFETITFVSSDSNDHDSSRSSDSSDSSRNNCWRCRSFRDLYDSRSGSSSEDCACPRRSHDFFQVLYNVPENPISRGHRRTNRRTRERRSSRNRQVTSPFSGNRAVASTSAGSPTVLEERDGFIIVNTTSAQLGSSPHCSICLENFTLQERVAYLQCTHIYHPGCIETWMATQRKCPVCREDID